jgi:hypothetical protein
VCKFGQIVVALLCLIAIVAWLSGVLGGGPASALLVLQINSRKLMIYHRIRRRRQTHAVDVVGSAIEFTV